MSTKARLAAGLSVLSFATALVVATQPSASATLFQKRCTDDNTTPYGRVCVAEYLPSGSHDNTVDAWFFNNKGGSNTLHMYLMSKGGDVRRENSGTVPAGGTLNATKDGTALIEDHTHCLGAVAQFWGKAVFNDGTVVYSPPICGLGDKNAPIRTVQATPDRVKMAYP